MRHFGWAVPFVLLPFAACANGARSGDLSPAGSLGSSAAGNGSTSGDGLFGMGPGAARGDGGRVPKCDTSENCTCINIASIGQTAHYGVAGLNSDSTVAFTDWLNSHSSASVDLYKARPMITADFLAKYDILIIQWLTDSNTGPYWTFDPSEIAALKTWVTAGGGLITLSGYDTSPEETRPLNQILSFTDISYNMDDVLTGCPPASAGQTNLCYCWGNSQPLGGWGQSPIAQHITQIGALHGRSINPGSATVDAADPSTGKVYAAHEMVGKGHVFAYADEWVTYSSQWLGTSAINTTAMYTDPNNPCYHRSAADVFQVPQFWYDVISWEASGTQCIFKLRDPAVIQ
ncbi:MAG: hypothetical protein M3O36_02350 [Myxococcota bacterium]|nr:hypothetical protein [Myxococcota bacterium]